MALRDAKQVRESTYQTPVAGLPPSDESLQGRFGAAEGRMVLQHILLHRQCGPSWGLAHISQPEPKHHTMLIFEILSSFVRSTDWDGRVINAMGLHLY
jgi:hypothetical protein